MKAFFVRLAGLAGLACLAAAPIIEPGLPEWKDGERDAWVPGGLLLGDDAALEESEQSAAEPLDVAQPTAEEIAETEAPSDIIPEQFWPAYFGERPKSLLVDPQGLLSAMDHRDRLGFLNYHAGDSSIDLFVYVFKGDQEIPGEVREEELVERFFSEGRPAAVVYYFMGAPQRSVLYLSPSLTDAVPAPEQRRALESSVMQAFETVDHSRQIESFMVQMSIRIYWMERMLNGGGDAAQNAPMMVRAAKSPVKKPDTFEKFAPYIAEAKSYAYPAGGFFGVLIAGCAMSSFMRSRARHRFPEFEVEPRLGGNHAAGVGAVISFASAALPPASQRDQVPDYLRRA